MPKAATQAAPPQNRETGAAPLPLLSYDVRINSLRMDGNTKGTASVTLNGRFAVRGISVMDGKNGLFVSMPSRKNLNGEYFDVCFPCTKESRAEFDKAVLTAFERARSHGTDGQDREAAETLPLRYDVRIHSLHPGDGALRGVASVNLNGRFAIRRVSVMESGKGLFVSMPGHKGRNGEFRDYRFPCTKESRAEFDKAVLGAYDRALAQNQTAGQSRDHAEAAPFEVGAQTDAPELRM